MNKENTVEVDIDSENVKLDLFANCAKAGQAKASNEIESRIVFHWNDLVVDENDLDPSAIYEFLKKMDHWISFVPKE